MYSLATLFHYLCICWFLVEGLFWLFTIISLTSPVALNILYWVDIPLEFGALMIIPLFLCQIVYPKEWSRYSAYMIPAYIIFQCKHL